MGTTCVLFGSLWLVAAAGMAWRFPAPSDSVPRFQQITVDGLGLPASQGYETAAELAGMVQNYSVVVLNNGVGPLKSTCRHANQYQLELCRRVKAAPGGRRVPCVAYMQGQFALGYVDATNSSWLNRSDTAHMWLKDPATGQPFSSRFQYPDVCPTGFDRFWDFRDLEARRHFLDEVQALADGPDVDGVFFDDMDISYCGGDCPDCGGISCSCVGEAEASKAAGEAMWSAAVGLWLEVAGLLNGMGKMPIFSSINKFSPYNWPFIPNRTCLHPEETFFEPFAQRNLSYARYYEMHGSTPDLTGRVLAQTCALDIQNLFMEGQRGIPVFVRSEIGGHTPAGATDSCHNTTVSAQFGFARFLVAAGREAFLSVYCGGYDDWNTRWFEEYRTQLGPATSGLLAEPGFAFRRQFARGEVFVNCSSQQARIGLAEL